MRPVQAVPGEPVQVMYVGGMPRSGTTLLDLMLGQLPEHVAVGELFHLWSEGLHSNLLCECGEPFAECVFWAEVGQRAYGGWDQLDRTRVAALVGRVDRTSALPLLLAPWLSRTFSARLQEYTDLLVPLYAAVRDVSGKRVVVDSSKRPSLAYVLRRSASVDLRVVQLVRDPRGVAHSWSKKVPLPPGAGVRDHLKVRSPQLIGRRWVTVNALIAALSTLGVPLVCLRYEDVVCDPQAALRRAADLFGTGLGEHELDFVAEDGLHLAPAHSVAGGRVRFRASPFALRLDERWRTDMPAGPRRLVEGMTALSRRRYGYR